MNPLINIDISLYFEVKNSEMFGGENSVGYASQTIHGVADINKRVSINNSAVKQQINNIAKLLNVEAKDVKLISKEEYDRETADSEDEE